MLIATNVFLNFPISMILLHYTNILYTETMKSRICTQIDWKIRQNQNLETIKGRLSSHPFSSIKQTNHLIMGKNSTSFYSISLVTNPFLPDSILLQRSSPCFHTFGPLFTFFRQIISPLGQIIVDTSFVLAESRMFLI